MFKKLLIVGLTLLTAACMPIPSEPPAASEPPQTTEQLADCSGGYLDMLPGQSANDPISTDLPDYLDIVRVDSSLDGETLTAIFYLRGIPEDIALNRKGVENMHLEYMWTVGIDVEMGEETESELLEYTFAAFYTASRVLADTPATTRPFQNAVRAEVWKKRSLSRKERNPLDRRAGPSPPARFSRRQHAYTYQPDSRHHRRVDHLVLDF